MQRRARRRHDDQLLVPQRGILAPTDDRATARETQTHTGPAPHRAHRGMSIREEVSEVDGVESDDADLETKVATLHRSELSDENLRAAIHEAGYEAA